MIGSVRPIYLTANGITDGANTYPATPAHPVGSARVEARAGYAVGGIKGNGRGFKIVFMRIEGTRLNPTDRYESEWLGGQGGEETLLGGDGRPVVGIFGQAGGMVDSLGLVQLELKEKNEKKP